MEEDGGVFVKRLSGALRILAEREPLMGVSVWQATGGRVNETNAADTNPVINHV